MTLTIRKANQIDLPYLYEICVKTGANGEDATDLLADKWMIGHYFAAPYLFFEPELCFIAEHQGIPLGYILGTSHSENFNLWLKKEWLPQLRVTYPKSLIAKSDLEQFILNQIHSEPSFDRNLSAYPSHLHIDLLPELQGTGMGRKLLTTFIEKLKKDGSTGVHLGVSSGNTNAIGFYRHMGLSEIKSMEGALLMGLRL